MAEYRYYLIPDFMSHVFPQQFEEQAPTEFFSNTADLMKRYQQLREMPYNNEYTWNERTNLPYPRLTVGIDRRDPDGAVTIMQVRSGVNYLRNTSFRCMPTWSTALSPSWWTILSTRRNGMARSMI